MVRALETEGVTHIFGVPGEENLEFLEALAESSIQFVLVRHEQAGGFMAATMGRLTGTPGVCFSTLGPGATNLMTAAAYAQLGGMPLVMITGQKPIRHSKQAAFQILDIVDMMQPVTQLSHRLNSGDWVPAMVHNAFRTARAERPGAVHLELPEDVAAMPVEEQPYDRPQWVPPAQAPRSELDRALKRLYAAKSPVLMLGAGAQRESIGKVLPAFVASCQMPFFSSQMGKGALDERHERCLGTAALSEGELAHQALAHADLIVTLGHDLVEKPPFQMERGGPEVMHIHTDAAQYDPLYFPQHELLGCMVHCLERLTEAFRAEPPTWSFEAMDPVLQTYRQRLDQIIDTGAVADHVASSTASGITPLQLIQTLRQALPEASHVALDNGMYKLWFARYYPAYGPQTLLLDNALASMGAGLPSAIATKLVYPDHPVVAVCGDGGFLMNSQSLETAQRLGLDLLVIVLNDESLGMIRWKQEKDNLQDFGLHFSNPDFAQLAKSYGTKGVRISRQEDLHAYLLHCKQGSLKGIHLLDVAIAYDQNDLEF